MRIFGIFRAHGTRLVVENKMNGWKCNDFKCVRKPT